MFALAELTGGTVTLLHAVPGYQDGVTELRRPVIGDLRGLKKQQMVALEMFRKTHFSGRCCFTRVEDGAAENDR
jgi:hypothetical protein